MKSRLPIVALLAASALSLSPASAQDKVLRIAIVTKDAARVRALAAEAEAADHPMRLLLGPLAALISGCALTTVEPV